MNGDSQKRESLREALLARLDEASSLDEFCDLLREIEQGRDAIGIGKSAELARSALHAIAELTNESPDIAAEVIRRDLLPWCLMPEQQDGKSSSAKLEGYRFRELLREWVYQYAREPMVELRSQVLQDVRQQLEAGPTKELLWVISTIGYRTSQVTELLWPILQRDDELADTTLGTLAGLGAAPDDRDRLLNLVRDWLASGRLSNGIRIAVEELVGPQYVDLAFKLLNLTVEKYSSEDHHDFALAVSVATRAVDRCSEGQAVHDEMWSVLRNHAKTVQMTSDYAYRCDTKRTVIDHVNWLLTGDIKGDQTIGAYIALSRLGELTKPRQLVGWDEVATDEFIASLERYAKHDTKIKGQYATTNLHVKEEAWETALTIGCLHIEDWIDAAVMEETNPYAVHSIAKSVACLRVRQLPKRLLDAIADVEADNDEKGRLFRQMGLIEIARSSCSREAFDSLLHFGLTHKGSVLLSTIDAITDVAIARLDEGDADVVDRVLEMTVSGNEQRHRDAAVSSFCRLCTLGHVYPEHLTRLWEFVNADDLDNYARCEAMEAIGLTDFDESNAWNDSIREIAIHDEGDLGWRACEALIRRCWITAADERWLFSRLGLDDRTLVRNPALTNGWQAFLVGLLFRQDKDRFSEALSNLLLHAPTDVVYQILEPLRHHAGACPNAVSEALARRIQTTNDNASTDTEFFRVLSEIAPTRLLNLSRACNWIDWLVEARTALCEAIRFVAIEGEESRAEAVACLIPFMHDASFQVRRSAYRAIAMSDIHVLEAVCEPWSRSRDVELRKRAAEAVAWLPIATHPDDRVSGFGFGWDTEPSVRERWEDVLSMRRERCWAVDYLDRVFSSCEDDDAVLRTHRFARALSKVGDDESVNRIEEFVATHKLRPHVKHWLKKTADEIRKHWKKVTDKWPEPWSHEQGSIEELHGTIVLPDGKRFDAKLSLWCRYRFGQSDLSAWGGVAEEVDLPFRFPFDVERIEIRVPGRPPASANVFGSRWSSSSATRLVLRGDSPYPAESSVLEPEGEAGVADVVFKAIREAGIPLESEDEQGASRFLQPILERADVSLLNLRSESDANARLKIACQEAALLTRSLAEFLPKTFETSAALWRIANSILERGGGVLRLSPSELTVFGEITRTGEREAPDEVLLWLMDHVDSMQANDVRPEKESDVKPRGRN